jgi:uncharacterized protein
LEGALFGLGMTLVGTCSFGLVVRAGSGDLKALMTAVVVGIFAFALTSGVLAPLRNPLLTVGVVNLGPVGTPLILPSRADLAAKHLVSWWPDRWPC